MDKHKPYINEQTTAKQRAEFIDSRSTTLTAYYIEDQPPQTPQEHEQITALLSDLNAQITEITRLPKRERNTQRALVESLKNKRRKHSNNW